MPVPGKTMKIDRQFPPSWSYAYDRLYRREWAAVRRADPRADAQSLILQTLGTAKREYDFTDVEFAKVLEAFRAISRPHDLLSAAAAAESQRLQVLFGVRRLIVKIGVKLGEIEGVSEGALQALRSSLCEFLRGRRTA